MLADGLVTLDEIRAARERIAPYVVRTPLVAMQPAGVLLKTESLQPSGSFKLRGAFHALLQLSDAQRRRGVIAGVAAAAGDAVARLAASRC